MGDDDGSIQFTITGSDHHRVKAWANIVVTLAALAIAIAGAIKAPPPAPAAKSSYDELKQAVERAEKAAVQNHEDIAALRGFLEGYMRATGVAPAPSASFTPSEHVKALLEIQDGGAPSVPPLPSIHPRPEPKKLPEFSELR